MSASTTVTPSQPLPALEQLWQDCLEHLEKNLPAQQFKTWVCPLNLGIVNLQTSPIQLQIQAPNRFKQTWAREQLLEPLTNWWQARLQKPVVVDIAVLSESSSDAPGTPDWTDQESNRPSFATSPEPVLAPAQENARLNPEWTFDQFVAGKANQLARAAALQVADNPGSGYNPLFLYGGVGLGKSHLIHSVGNKMVEGNPQARIRYIHAEAYVSDVVRAYQRKSFDELKQYYHSLDLLLIDDIQFFGGKSRTQEEFFYAFEALIAAKKQIIITSDTYPKEITGMDDRLISRFDSGLTVAVEPPELEMRVAILLKKASQEGAVLNDDVAFFVAKHLRSNVRELEGALRKILAYSRFHGKEITIDVVKDALKDLLSVQNRQISVENIQKTVADFFNIKVADMYSKKRPANIARPRQIAMYLAKELTQKSLPEIGELFGGRDHTTVLHAVRKIAADRSKNPECNHELHVLEQTLKG